MCFVKSSKTRLVVALGVSLALSACASDKKSDEAVAANPAPAKTEQKAEALEASKAFNPRLLRRFAAVRTVVESPGNALSPEKVQLGRMLYFDKRLSKNQNVSCNSCHQLDAYGVDREPTSPGDAGERGGRNSPTVYHAAGYFTQFWDGRAADVEEQAKGPILNPIEMAMPSPEAVVARIKGIIGYEQPFRRAFPGVADPITYDAVGIAI